MDIVAYQVKLDGRHLHPAAFFTSAGCALSSIITIRTATTAAGKPCKNYAIVGTQLSKGDGGSTLNIRHSASPNSSFTIQG